MAQLQELALLSLLKQLDSGKELTKTGNADIDNQLFYIHKLILLVIDSI